MIPVDAIILQAYFLRSCASALPIKPPNGREMITLYTLIEHGLLPCEITLQHIAPKLGNEPWYERSLAIPPSSAA